MSITGLTCFKHSGRKCMTASWSHKLQTGILSTMFRCGTPSFNGLENLCLLIRRLYLNFETYLPYRSPPSSCLKCCKKWKHHGDASARWLHITSSERRHSLSVCLWKSMSGMQPKPNGRFAVCFLWWDKLIETEETGCSCVDLAYGLQTKRHESITCLWLASGVALALWVLWSPSSRFDEMHHYRYLFSLRIDNCAILLRGQAKIP